MKDALKDALISMPIPCQDLFILGSEETEEDHFLFFICSFLGLSKRTHRVLLSNFEATFQVSKSLLRKSVAPMSGKVGGKHPVKDPPTAATSEEVGSKRKKREEESRGEQLSWKDGGPSSGGAERRTHKGTGFDHRIAIKNTQASGGYVGAKDDGRTPVQR